MLTPAFGTSNRSLKRRREPQSPRYLIGGTFPAKFHRSIICRFRGPASQFMEASSQVLENELPLEVDGFVFKFYPRAWPRNYIGFVSEEQIAEMRKYLVYRSTHGVIKGTKLWWRLYFYREPRENSTPVYDIEKRPIRSCGEVGYIHKRPVPEAFEKYFFSEPELRQAARIESQQSDQGQNDVVSQEQQQSTPSSAINVSGNRKSPTIACGGAAAQREETWILDSQGGNFLRNRLNLDIRMRGFHRPGLDHTL